MNVFLYLQDCITKNINFDTIIIDAPYNEKFARKYSKYNGDHSFDKEQFIIFANARKTTELFSYIYNIDPKIIIIKSWNYYIPKGYTLKFGFLCYAGGYRKPTILEILEKNSTGELNG